MLSGLFSVYPLAIAREKGGNRDAQYQTAKRKELTNNQTKTPNGVITFTFPPLVCLAWKILITDGREVNEQGACLKISFSSVFFKLELCHLCKSLLPSAKGLSIYFYVVSSPSRKQARETE